MKPGYAERRKRQTLRAMVFVTTLIALALATWLMLKVTHVLPADTTTAVNVDNLTIPQQNSVLAQDEALHEQLNELNKLDDAYSAEMTTKDSANSNGLEEINARISAGEEGFARSIDSISKLSPTIPNKVTESFFVNMIMSFRSALQNRKSISNLRNAISKDNTVLDPAQKAFFKLQNELLQKDTRIANLETSLKVLQNAPPVIKQPAAVNAFALENKSLKEKLAASDNKVAGFTAANTSLKKDYDRIAKQLSDAANVPNTDQAAKTKAASLENKVDDLNAALGLAQVDCNLSRVDAKQIISNAKQRKILLSEALNILNSLSKSNNAAIKKQVKEKIDRLNEIATNSRD